MRFALGGMYFIQTFIQLLLCFGPAISLSFVSAMFKSCLPGSFGLGMCAGKYETSCFLFVKYLKNVFGFHLKYFLTDEHHYFEVGISTCFPDLLSNPELFTNIRRLASI